MERYQQEICGDCINHKGKGNDIICQLTGEKPHYEHRCHDFKANNSQRQRYTVTKTLEREELEGKGNAWLCCLGCAAIIALVFGSALSIEMERYAYVYLAIFVSIALAALGIYIFVCYRNKSHAIDIDIAKCATTDDKPQSPENSHTEAKESDNRVTTDRAIRCLKELGYAPKCERSEDGTHWIYIVYGDDKVLLTIVDDIVQIVFAYSWGGLMDNCANIQNFLLAANRVMQYKRFVQITGDEEGCRFTISGYVPSMIEFEFSVPLYLRAISEAVHLHREVFQSFVEQDVQMLQPNNNDNKPVN